MKLPWIRREATSWLVGLVLVGIALLSISPWLDLPVLGLLVFLAFFFRDPDRRTKAPPEAIVAPADGKVMDISDVVEEDFLKQSAIRVGIFLSVLDVHINRSPIAGRVRYLRYEKGKFRPAYKSEAILHNERNIVGLEGTRGKVLVVQIAGVLARRIECDVREGDELVTGQSFGMIRLGSRTELFLPKAAVQLTVSPGARVKAGETVIGRWI